jgi:hypothetical protein
MFRLVAQNWLSAPAIALARSAGLEGQPASDAIRCTTAAASGGSELDPRARREARALGAAGGRRVGSQPYASSAAWPGRSDEPIRRRGSLILHWKGPIRAGRRSASHHICRSTGDLRERSASRLREPALRRGSHVVRIDRPKPGERRGVIVPLRAATAVDDLGRDRRRPDAGLKRMHPPSATCRASSPGVLARRRLGASRPRCRRGGDGSGGPRVRGAPQSAPRCHLR